MTTKEQKKRKGEEARGSEFLSLQEGRPSDETHAGTPGSPVRRTALYSERSSLPRTLWPCFPVRSLAFTALSGLLLAGALPHLDWGGLAWVGLVPFLTLFPFKNTRTAFAHGLVLGVFYLGVMAYWVGVFAGHIIGPALSVVGWALVTLYQAFYIGVWAVGTQWLWRRGIWARRLGVPALWAIVEWWRQSGTLGLGWGDLAYTQHSALLILQTTKLTGIWGLAFLIVLVNGALAELWFTGLNPRALKEQLPAVAGRGNAEDVKIFAREGGGLPFKAWGFSPMSFRSFPAAVALLLLAALTYGTVTIRTEQLKPAFVAAALQGDINQNVDQNPAYTARVVQTFNAQSREAAARGAVLTVWPETAYPGYLQNSDLAHMQVAAETVRDHQAALIGGVEYDWAQRKNANALLLLLPTGVVSGSYQKRQLVPFGEFVPGRRFLPFLEALHVTTFDMKAGADSQPLLDAGPVIGKVGATICFESSYPRFLREQVARGAGLLVISTDDAWFGRTAAARQHSAIAAVRAAETDRYLVRSAATGISQVISPTGQVLAEADLFRPAVVAAPVQSRSTRTPYVRWGDWFIGFCVLLLAAALLPGFKRGNNGTF